MHKKNTSSQNIGVGTKTNEGYVYNTKIDLGKDLHSQISILIRERKAKQELDNKINQINNLVKKYKNKLKNLDYYFVIGKELSFLNSGTFKKIKPFSVFRRIADEVSNIVPYLENKRVVDHLMMMYRIGSLEKKDLSKATWEQWYEISKFKDVISNTKILKIILKSCNKKSGPILREKIKSILKN